MKFAHLADIHIGSWRDPKLKDISSLAFVKAIDECIREKVDFVLIAGDLFNTAVPGIDIVKTVVTKFKELKDRGIPIYGIPGSHDFSPSGKTMLDVLEEAGLFMNVFKGTIDQQTKALTLKFITDPKTGAKIAGIIGKRGMLDRKIYENLNTQNLEQEQGYKIFMFHTAIAEIHPEIAQFTECASLSMFPKNMDYYAGGHIHKKYNEDHSDQGYGRITLPGPLFPCSFPELEKQSKGGFYIIDNENVEWRPVQVFNTFQIKVDCTGKSVQDIENEIKKEIQDKEFLNTIVLIRLSGHMENGKPSAIDFKEIYAMLYAKSAYFIMKNTAAVTTEEFKEVQAEVEAVEDVESLIIDNHAGQIKSQKILPEQEKKLAHELLRILNTEREEGEKVADFEKRVLKETEHLFE